MARRSAFTLVELSVVLVVLGLLVGGIITGKSMLRAQNLRNILQDAKTYAIAKQLFADKYGALPGDMPDAVRIWGKADADTDLTTNCAHPDTDASVGNLTCNGDGNGIMDTGSAGVGNWEIFRAWQQLAAAGMITGNYTGVHGSGSSVHAIRGTNVPAGALPGSVFFFRSLGDQAGGTTYYAGNYDNMMVFGGVVASNWPYGPVLTPLEAFEMDQKIDDSLPGLGRVRTFAKTWMLANTGDCVDSNTQSSAVYKITTKAAGCFLVFMSNFQAKPQ